MAEPRLPARVVPPKDASLRTRARLACRLPNCGRDRQRADGLCEMHGNNLVRRGDVYAYAPRTVTRMAIDALLLRLTTPEALEPGECWQWPSPPAADGYGSTQRLGEFRSSRAAWVAVHGSVPDGLWVLHHCDNRMCVRPSHLYVGTPSDNVRDMDMRGRRAVQGGERHHSAKYSDETLRVVRERFERGERQCDIVRDLGIHNSWVSRVVRGLTRRQA